MLKPLLEEEEKDFRKVVDLKLITGGKGGDDDKNWLKKLEPGTTFLFRSIARRGPDDLAIGRAAVVYHYDNATLLYDNLNQEHYFIVETAPFSNTQRLMQVLDVPNKQEETVS